MLSPERIAELKKKASKVVLRSSFIALGIMSFLFYGFFSFIFGDTNPMEWNMFCRILYGVGFVFYFFFMVSRLDEHEKSTLKRLIDKEDPDKGIHLSKWGERLQEMQEKSKITRTL